MASGRHQAIVSTDVDLLSKVFCGIHPRMQFRKKVLMNLIRIMSYTFEVTATFH